ncbi:MULTISPECIES: phosphatidate cytidylyltransferase [Clostridium]|uniref:phosphatidate cytidylyltransferase n=1 Tax=Clostridium TaxID=1485 RepID=UPI0004014966|nr:MULTISPECIES: phosphatidate cytidylyltransferase [Clostridium]MBS6886343.1 phosphatidate cytidylyltransferase [Clostridium sp.]MDB2103950.1 phosphatidate cytidylyltransferase [Clostridium paraputrificum]MDB2108967.1 phosphatidate cytidylyltransferase [Clostridium paraputrificum]MDB2122617.1 phosphatidate cytidylyltransferase [Clostridium paraputrificum]MDC0802891.1 phosphatidate cytidylyltransferase [Clostridium paraputrificum]
MKSDNRYLGALMIAPFILFIFWGGLPLKIFTFILSAFGMYEFYKALKEKDFKPIEMVGYILLILFYLFNNDFEKLIFMIILATFILLIIPVIDLKYTFIDAAITLLGFLYVGILFSFIYLVSEKSGGAFYVWLIFIGSWMTDTTAYYAGRLFGKTKLCPKVSPKKTIEGSIGGLIGSTISCGILGFVAKGYIATFPIYHFFIIGALCGVFSQFGDLVASSVKRYVGIKDYSNLIPGHGGILDRFDSILFSGLIVFYYLTFILSL